MVLRLLEQGWSLAEAAEAAGVSERTCSKRVVRYRVEGEPGLHDRSSAPRSVRHRTSEEFVAVIASLRRLRMTGAEIAFRHGITVERVMSDNGSASRSTLHAVACRTLGLRHLRTQPYRPRTNGKAERLIRTLLGGWADGAIYGSSRERTTALDGWLWTSTIAAHTAHSATRPRSLASTS